MDVLPPKFCLLMLLLSVSCGDCGGYHSEKWRSLYRSKRDTSTWQNVNEFPTCTLEGNLTRYDALGRRESGLLVTPGQQGTCGSCWAFAVAHAFADHLRINDSSMLVSFSVDHLTKCHTEADNGNGCCGSSLTSALRYLVSKGAYPASCLPYTLTKSVKLRYRDNVLTCPSRCNDSSPFVARKLPGYQCIEEEQQVMDALQNGTVIAALRINDMDMMNLFEYRCGIYTASANIELGHAVEIVDYSSPDYTGPAFWVVKNSLGADWGESGYFRIQRGTGLLDMFFSLSIDGSVSTLPPNSADSPVLCGVRDIPQASSKELVQMAAEYGIQTLNTKKSLRCSTSFSFFRPTVESFQIWNATEQVIEGLLLVIEVSGNLTGCFSKTTVAIQMVVMVEMNGDFNLLDFSYLPMKAAVAAAGLPSASILLLVALAIATLTLTFQGLCV